MNMYRFFSLLRRPATHAAHSVSRIALTLCLMGVLAPHTLSPFLYSFNDLFSTKGLGFAFASSDSARRDTEYQNRKNQLAKLEEEYVQFQVRASSEIKKIDDALAGIESRQENRDFVREELKSREHILKTNRQLYAAIDKLISQRIEHLRRFVGVVKNDIDESIDREKSTKPDENKEKRYTWQDFKVQQQELDRILGLQTKEENSLKIAISALETERERQLQLERSIRQVEAALSSDIHHAANSEEKERLEARLDVVQKRHGSEKNKILLQLQLAEQRIHQIEDELAFYGYERMKKNDTVQYIKDHLVFVAADIEKAARDLAEAKDRAANVIRDLDTQLRTLRADRQKWEIAKREADATGLSTESAIAANEKTSRHLSIIDEQILLAEYKRKYEETVVRHKEWQKLIIEKMHELRSDESGLVVEKSIDTWMAQFAAEEAAVTTLQSEVKNALKSLDIRREDITTDKSVIAERIASARSSDAAKVYKEVSRLITQRHQVYQDLYDALMAVKGVADRLEEDVRKMCEALGDVRGSLNIWQRSKAAISQRSLMQALNEARGFARYVGRTATAYLLPPYSFEAFLGYDWMTLLWGLLYLLAGFAFVRLFRKGLGLLSGYLEQLLYAYQGQLFAIYITVLRSLVRFISYYGRGIGVWIYLRLFLAVVYTPMFDALKEAARIREYSGSLYLISLFYLITIPFFLYISYQLMREVKKINQRMSFLFFTEKLEEKFLFLLSIILYVSATVFPLKAGIISYLNYTAHVGDPHIIAVLNGAWTLGMSIAFLFFFSKEDIIKLIPTHVRVGQIVSYFVDTYYYPVFFFFMGLFILMNPYVGYHNLAGYLAFSVPTSVAALYILLKMHASVHQYVFSLFMRDDEIEENEVVDRVDNAKLYYGVSIILLFMAALAGAFVAITKIWRLDYGLSQLWYSISKEWVIKLGDTGDYIGFGGIVTIVLFFLGGFVVSSLFNRFVLPRLFAIFRTEQGAQNTVSRILHYIIICLASFFGLYAIKLTQFVNNLALALLVGITFGIKDLLADFFAGIWILLERPIEPGNFIETGDLRGTVKKIAIRATTIKTARNFTVIIPNRELVAKPIVNWGADYYGVGVEFSVMLPYQLDPQDTKQLILDVVNQHKLVLRMPAAVVRCESFEERGVLFFVRAFISSRRVREQWEIASDIRISLLLELKARGIRVPYQQVIVHDARGVVGGGPNDSQGMF